ncbi:MAG: sugar phosphate nucleotidyltransferase, partial [Halobacteriales archaeon]
GEGRRLEPLTDVRPKPMLPVANRPLLEHVVESVVAAGIEEIVLVVGYKRERIQSHFEDGDDWGIDIEYVVQEKQLGTGHAVLQAEDRIGGTFLVLNGDRVIEPAVVEEMIEAPADGETLMAVTRTEDPRGFGVVESDGERVSGIAEKPPRHAITSEVINAGVYRLQPEVFDAIRETETAGELALTATLDRLAADGTVRAIRYRGTWLDVSYLWDLITVNASLLDEGTTIAATARTGENAVVTGGAAVDADAWIGPSATVLSGTAVGENARVGANAVIENTLVFPGATIGAGSVIRDCVVGENASLGPNTTIEGGAADVAVDGSLHEGVTLGGVFGDNTSLGGSVNVRPGARVGNGATVEGGAAVSGRVPSGAEVRRG